MVRISEVFFKIRKNCTILRFRSHNNNNNNNNRLYTFKNFRMACKSWRYEVFENRSRKISRLYVSTHLQGLQLQKFINEIRTSGSHNVRFRRSAPLSENICTNVLSYYASRLAGTTKTLECLSQKSGHSYS